MSISENWYEMLLRAVHECGSGPRPTSRHVRYSCRYRGKSRHRASPQRARLISPHLASFYRVIVTFAASPCHECTKSFGVLAAHTSPKEHAVHHDRTLSMVHWTWRYVRNQSTNHRMPSSIGVLGRKPTVRSRSELSAHVSSTSPGCIGRNSRIAGRPATCSITRTSSSTSTGWLFPTL